MGKTVRITIEIEIVDDLRDGIEEELFQRVAALYKHWSKDAQHVIDERLAQEVMAAYMKLGRAHAQRLAKERKEWVKQQE